MSATTNLGKVCVTPKGQWYNYTEYEVLDIVSDGGSSYLAIQDVPDTGVALTNASYWLCIAEKGDGGEITSVSASISGGYGTPGVTVTEGGTSHEKTLAFAFSNLVGNGVASITQTTTSSVSGGTNIITCTLVDGTVTTFAILNGTDGDAINIAPAYSSSATYDLGDLVVYNSTLYECTTAITTAEAWNSAHWTATDVKTQLSKKANIDGSYDLMNVGTSDNWTPYSADSGATQDIPFINEATGGGNGESVVDTGSYLQFKKKLGNTVAVNQLVKDITLATQCDAQQGTLSASNGIGTLTASGSGVCYARINIEGMKYPSRTYALLIDVMFDNANTGNYPNSNLLLNWSTGGFGTLTNPAKGVWQTLAVNVTPTAASTFLVVYPFGSGTTPSSGEKVYIRNPRVIGLTLWFGSNDRIPSDLLSHPENWGRYYAGSLAYNAGTLVSADGTVMKSIGRNLFNKATVTDGKYVDNADGTLKNASNLSATDWIEVVPNTSYFRKTSDNSNGWGAWYDRSQNYISGFGSGQYSYTAPPNAAYCRFTVATALLDVVCWSIYYPGESGYDQYYPFSVLAEVDTGSEVLRGVEGSRDEKLPNGTITRRRKRIDLGTLNYQSGTSGIFFSDVLTDTPEFNISTTDPKVINPKYIYASSAYGNLTNDKVFCINGGRIWIVDTAYSDVATFKAAMSGVYFEYPLATPTTEQGTAFAENIPCDDFGSLSWTQTKGIPQGNEIFYPVDYKASFDTLYNIVDGDMSELATDTELQAVADRIPDAPSTDGTYSLKVSVSGGTKTYSWVADE